MSKQLSIHTKEKIEKLLANTGDMALKRRARRIVEELDPKEGERILDVGCGDGYYLYLLSNLGLKPDLTGADFDPNALASAKRNLKGKRIKLFQADLMVKLPFKSESFNKIVMSEVAEHLPDDIEGLREVYRVLQPGGVLCLSVPNANYPFLWDPVNWILEHFFGTHIKNGFWAGIWNQHRRLYRPQEIGKVAEKAGFKIIKVESLTWWCLPFNHNLLHLAARMLYGGRFSPKVVLILSKYERKARRPPLIDIVFGLVNTVDELNNLWQPKGMGVSVFLKAIK